MGRLTQCSLSSCGPVAFVVLLCTCSVIVPVAWAQDQTGFLNIDCGASKSYVDQVTGLTWVPDVPYTTTGINEDNIPLAKSNYSQYPEYSTLRYFNDSRAKNCYSFGVAKNTAYMLRTTFFYGNYDNALKPPSFKLVIDASVVEDVVTSADAGVEFEHTYLTQGNLTFLCLVRTSNSSTPFISGITLKPSPYISFNYDLFNTYVLTDQKFMSIRTRVNFGGTDVIRFPKDPYDRYWYPEGVDSAYLKKTISPLKRLSTTTQIVDDNYNMFNRSIFPAPQVVLQTAVATEHGTFTCNFLSPLKDATVTIPFPILHFAELDPAANYTSRVLVIQIWQYSPANWPTENTFNVTPTSPGPYHWDYWWFGAQTDSALGPNTVFNMEPAPVSAWGPILNALEVFAVSTDPAVAKTVDRDVFAIENIKLGLNLTEWTGDPCLPYPHPWLSCSDDVPPHITVVNLAGYQLVGTFPPDFSNLVGLTSLLLDNNEVTGTLPDLSYMTNLVILRLQNNNLSGVLPGWLASLTHLTELSVQNNNFSGSIPPALLSLNTLQFTYNPGNPLLTGGNNDTISSSKSSSSNTGAVIGGIVGGVLGAALVLGILICLYCRKIRKESPAFQRRKSLPEIGTSAGAKAYTLAEVIAATSNFKTEIGKGGFGPVFYGRFPDGQEVGVKVSDGSSRHGRGQSQGAKEFFNEVDVLSRVRHKNLVALVGYCQDDRKQILIYEYMHTGSVHDQLRGKSVGAFDWKTRLHVALCAAQGLEYLHTGCSPSFIHRDIKSSNILISAKGEAKVADFGLTKLMGEDDPSHVTTFVKGTAGYLDPEYCNTELLSTKSDIYSFGVVLLELLTGRPPIDRSGLNQNPKPGICDWTRSTLEDGNIDAILAPEVRASKPRPNTEALWKVTEIALQCVEPLSMYRPTMTVVLQELHQAIGMEEAASPMGSSGVFAYSGGSELGPMAR